MILSFRIQKLNKMIVVNISSNLFNPFIVKGEEIKLCKTKINIVSPNRVVDVDHDVLLFPILVKNNKNGKNSYWLQFADGVNVFRFEWIENGQTIKEFANAIGQEKNVGKKNHVTAEQDALRLALHSWKNKVSTGYSPSNVAKFQGSVVEWNLIEEEKKEEEDEVILPMLAIEFDESKLRYPVGVSPKLDGIRCITKLSDDIIHLTSRREKVFEGPNFISIAEQAKTLLKLYDQSIMLDGELYIHGFQMNEIASIVRTQKKKHKEADSLEYHIFDVVMVDKMRRTTVPYVERAKILAQLANVALKNNLDKLRFIFYEKANNKEEIHSIYQKTMQQGYEGVIIRNLDSPYLESFRSADLQKYKQFATAEFEIVGVTKSVGGTEDGAAIIEVKANGGTFTVRMQGSIASRRELYKKKDQLIGKMLTVKYQPGMNGMPRFPVGVTIRDYE